MNAISLKPKCIEKVIDATRNELQTENFNITFQERKNDEAKVTQVEVWNNATQKWIDIDSFPEFVSNRLFQEAVEILEQYKTFGEVF